MANYAIDRKLLLPFVPAGTEIDGWQDTCYVSLVGFMFLNVRRTKSNVMQYDAPGDDSLLRRSGLLGPVQLRYVHAEMQ